MTQVSKIHSENRNKVEKANILDALEGDNEEMILKKSKSSFDRRQTLMEKKNSKLLDQVDLVRQKTRQSSKKAVIAPII